MYKFKTLVWVGVGCALATLFGYGIYAATRGESYVAPNESQITAFSVEQPFFVARGRGLSRVEVWAIPTGTNITEEQHVLLGKAQNFSAEGNGEQVWRTDIPQQPVLAVEIFAKGYTRRGDEVGRISLTASGATDIYNKLWGGESSNAPRITEADKDKTFSYKPGDKFSVVLDQKLFVSADFYCTPQNAVRELGNVPALDPPLFGTRYEAMRSGTCTLEAGDLEIGITIVP